jgi:hypothetical protein
LTHHLALAKPSSNTQARVLSLLALVVLAKFLLLVAVEQVVNRLGAAAEAVAQVDMFMTLQFYCQQEL